MLARSGRVASSAGSSANTRLARTPAANAKPSRRGSSGAENGRRMRQPSWSSAVSRPEPIADARASPRPPPARPSSRPSRKSCRTRRPRPAPSASRVAISRRRSSARARNRLATLAEASSNPRPKTPSASSEPARSGALDPGAPGPEVDGHTRGKRRAGADRQPQVRRQAWGQPAEGAGRDADDGEAPAVQAHLATDRLRRGGEDPPPGVVAQHRDRGRVADPIVFRRERAAERRLHAEQPEVVSGHQLGHHQLGAVAAFEGQRVPGVGRGAGEGRRRLVADGLVVGERHRRVAQEVAGNRAVDVDEAFRLGHGQRPEQKGVHQAEGRAVEADAEGERRGHQDRERRLAPDRSKRVAKVVPPAAHAFGLRVTPPLLRRGARRGSA